METEEERIHELRKERDECSARCVLLTKELEAIDEFIRKESVKGITLPPDSKLIDLLKHRILDPSPDWKTKVDTLINIPTSDTGSILRGGDYFEALFQLSIAIGIIPEFENIEFYDVKGYKEIKKVDNYLHTKTIKNSGGGEQGISDITFKIRTDSSDEHSTGYKCGDIISDKKHIPGSYYFISVKGFKKEKSIKDSYDIPILDKQLTLFPEITNKHIVVCVKNKQQFLKRLGRTRIEFLKNSIDKVIGYDEIMDVFTTFRTNFFLKLAELTNETIEHEVNRIFPESNIYKTNLNLYFHQELITKSVLRRIDGNPAPTKPHFMCIGVLPRGGKSFIAGGIIDEHRKLKNSKEYNVLFLTSAINETRDQFKDDLIEKFSEFGDFDFIDIVNPQTSNKKKCKFVFVSRQLSSLATDKEVEGSLLTDKENKNLVSRIKKILKQDVKFDICFFDEAHIGIKSDNVRKQFESTFNEFKMPIVLMTATYKKPAMILDSPSDLFVWDLQDVKDMKDLSMFGLEKFIEKSPDILQRYPEISQQIIQNRVNIGQTLDDIAKPYVNFPNPNFISLAFTPESIKKLKDIGMGYDYMRAFKTSSNKALLSDNEKYSEWGNLLDNRSEAVLLRQFLTPIQEDSDDFLINENKKYRALNQIFSIAHKTMSRPFIGRPFSMIMFLPFGEGYPIGELCRIWASFMLELRYWKENFVFMTLSTYSEHKPNAKMTPKLAVERGICHREDFKSKSLKHAIQDIEQEALKNGKGLVLLSGDVAKMGISLKCVDIVCLMSNNTDPDDIIQKMYRALTDDPPTKKNGYIIDLNIKRIVRAMFDYDMEKSRRTISGKMKAPEERLRQLMELCNWGQDAYIQENTTTAFNDVMDQIRKRVFEEVGRNVSIEYGSRGLVDKQFDVIQNNKDLLDNVISVLRNTSGKRSVKNKEKETLLEKGSDVPDSVSEAVSETSAKTEEKVEPLSIEQIKKKIVDIMITFVNALVIKSDHPWNNMTFETLINKYNEDKKTASDTLVCDCSTEKHCESMFSNSYEIVACELRSYAMLQTKKDETVYDERTHKRIMELMDDIFSQSASLSPDWTNYIDSLIKDITKQNSIGGGAIIKTNNNKKRTLYNKNVRKTIRNYTRNDRKTSYTRRASKKV